MMYWHLATVVPCFIIGTILLLIEKGTKTHMITVFMPAHVGPRILNHFGWIHIFSFLAIYTVPTAYWAIKKGNIRSHKRKMIILYFGAIIIAGGFTFMPGRYLYELFF